MTRVIQKKGKVWPFWTKQQCLCRKKVFVNYMQKTVCVIILLSCFLLRISTKFFCWRCNTYFRVEHLCKSLMYKCGAWWGVALNLCISRFAYFSKRILNQRCALNFQIINSLKLITLIFFLHLQISGMVLILHYI